MLDVDYYDYGSLMGTEFGMDKRERILTGASGSSHAMTLMAVDLDEYGQAKKWKVENSWGMTGHEGHLVMTDEWFEEYMFRLVAENCSTPSRPCFRHGIPCSLTNFKIDGKTSQDMAFLL